MIRYAVDTLTALPGAAVYLDAGHSNWMPAAEIAPLLIAAGIDKADGFSLNVSNYQWTADLLKYGHDISARVGGKHFIIDTGRNGNGPPTGFDKKDERNWCNPDGRALGTPPTTNTGDPLCDAFFWLKPPGESDGTCNQGPAAGVWWPAEGAGDGAQREVVSAARGRDFRRRADLTVPSRDGIFDAQGCGAAAAGHRMVGPPAETGQPFVRHSRNPASARPTRPARHLAGRPRDRQAPDLAGRTVSIRRSVERNPPARGGAGGAGLGELALALDVRRPPPHARRIALRRASPSSATCTSGSTTG